MQSAGAQGILALSHVRHVAARLSRSITGTFKPVEPKRDTDALNTETWLRTQIHASHSRHSWRGWEGRAGAPTLRAWTCFAGRAIIERPYTPGDRARLDQGSPLEAIRRVVAAMVGLGDRLVALFGDPHLENGIRAR
jgi:hypothetical protein